MEMQELIKWVVVKLMEMGIPYAIGGSIASSFHGMPRFTHDIDIIITINKKDIDQIVQIFSPYGYISKEGISNAFKAPGMFNFIHERTGIKVDFWVNRGDPFAAACLSRAKSEEIAEGLYAVISSAEDVLLHKIYWNKLTPSERQLRDAMGIVAVQGDRLERSYIQIWAEKLGIREEINTLFKDKSLPNLT